MKRYQFSYRLNITLDAPVQNHCFTLRCLPRSDPRQRQKLHGSVEIYPAVNPLGIDSIQRGIPGFDLDMNRTFPGSDLGDMTEYIGASKSGLLFTIREYPLVDEGSLMGRILVREGSQP